MKQKIINVKVPKYTFDSGNNPFAFNFAPQRKIDDVASIIENAIIANFDYRDILIRGIQSGYHSEITRTELINNISKNGSDKFEANVTDKNEMFATKFELGIVKKILEGFHVYKPKCDESPQYPVDIWMIFNASAYSNIEYMHPRHKVLARDKWRLGEGNNSAMIGIVIIN